MNLKTNNKRTQKGITLIALVVTIVVLLILAGVSLNAIFSENGIINRAKDAQNKMDQATQSDLDGLNDLDKLISSLTDKTTEDKVPDELERYFLGEDKKGTSIFELVNADENGVTFIGNDIIPDAETSIKFKDSGEETENIGNIKIEYKNEYYIVTADMETGMTKTIKKAAKMTVTMFDTGKNVRVKIGNLVSAGTINAMGLSFNVSVDAIEQYNKTLDLTKMTENNIVSVADSEFPIYMWFEKNGKTEIRNISGETNLTEENEASKRVETGTIYWWSEANNVYLNPDSSRMFELLPYLSDIDGLKDMKTNYVVDMAGMFYTWGSLLTNVNALANWDTSKVTNMSYMFAGNGNLTNIDGLRNWNTSNVTNMKEMFGGSDSVGCGFTSLSAISNWDVNNVTDMSNMFWGCHKLEDISGIWNWNITEIASCMFFDCYALANITIPSTVIKIREAFGSCLNITKVKIFATDANKFEVGIDAFNNLASNSKIYVLSEEIKAKLEGSYNTSETTVEVVTLDQMNNL